MTKVKVYIFGNPDISIDNKPFKFLPELTADFPDIQFITVKPNEDLPFESQEEILLVDTVEGLKDITILDETAVDKFSFSANASVHDYDLGFQLKYLKKLGKINKLRILGLPADGDINYKTFQSSFKKFVAQDMQGS